MKPPQKPWPLSDPAASDPAVESSGPHPGGRPRALDDVKKAEIAAMISVGCSKAAACRYVGCVPATLRNELRRDAGFAARVRRAERHRQLVALQQIQKAGARSWRAAAWLLERLNPEDFHRRDPDVVTREQLEAYVQSFVEALSGELTREQFQRLGGLLRKNRAQELRDELDELIGEDPTLDDFAFADPNLEDPNPGEAAHHDDAAEEPHPENPRRKGEADETHES
ncbi:MAG: hypothetical protein DWQ31_06840 [Planctomycetota bacterium]|nr:MAG: hypothetical protein DWQ31_06840 [Planctomycetota bacterium]REJ90311.1 MAG: hypothetical protein DWQ35_16665 [Planctomycetota bacterium]REJ95620.1 MAG: hypothetical protein DWQ35_06275 [Planctomycetota bacterium]REK25184.1 MAG: hypothetical protein DWQ42_11965 [Planctomycetota bacterium]REK40948.1 MAG: hypothetical protein DWQ46_14775 [Planctomycetota bacterium]